jgi:hypothetical protein
MPVRLAISDDAFEESEESFLCRVQVIKSFSIDLLMEVNRNLGAQATKYRYQRQHTRMRNNSKFEYAQVGLA